MNRILFYLKITPHGRPLRRKPCTGVHASVGNEKQISDLALTLKSFEPFFSLNFRNPLRQLNYRYLLISSFLKVEQLCFKFFHVENLNSKTPRTMHSTPIFGKPYPQTKNPPLPAAKPGDTRCFESAGALC